MDNSVSNVLRLDLQKDPQSAPRKVSKGVVLHHPSPQRVEYEYSQILYSRRENANDFYLRILDGLSFSQDNNSFDEEIMGTHQCPSISEPDIWPQPEEINVEEISSVLRSEQDKLKCVIKETTKMRQVIAAWISNVVSSHKLHENLIYKSMSIWDALDRNSIPQGVSEIDIAAACLMSSITDQHEAMEIIQTVCSDENKAFNLETAISMEQEIRTRIQPTPRTALQVFHDIMGAIDCADKMKQSGQMVLESLLHFTYIPTEAPFHAALYASHIVCTKYGIDAEEEVLKPFAEITNNLMNIIDATYIQRVLPEINEKKGYVYSKYSSIGGSASGEFCL